MTVRICHLVACLEQLAGEIKSIPATGTHPDMAELEVHMSIVIKHLQSGDFHPNDAVIEFI